MTALQEALSALKADLIDHEVPRISTMRNYRFAIVTYAPKDEFRLRREVQTLSAELVGCGWAVVLVDLQKVLLDRLRAQEDGWLDELAQREQRLAANGLERALNYVKSKILPVVEGPQGVAADCSRIICDFTDRNPDKADRTLALIGRAGALYPFLRTSALLRHLDGATRNVPVVLLYPGERRGQTGLSFMGRLNPDNDYRPRIYP